MTKSRFGLRRHLVGIVKGTKNKRLKKEARNRLRAQKKARRVR